AVVCGVGVFSLCAASRLATQYGPSASDEAGAGVKISSLEWGAIMTLGFFIVFAAFLSFFPAIRKAGVWRLGISTGVGCCAFGFYGQQLSVLDYSYVVAGFLWGMATLISVLMGTCVFAVTKTPKRLRRISAVWVLFIGLACLGALFSAIDPYRMAKPEPQKETDAPKAPKSTPAENFDESFVSARHAIPRVILITIDTLRRDKLGCYGECNCSPNIDAFAEEAIIFDHCLAPSPWTLPSLASLHTGLAPGAHGAITPHGSLSKKLDTLAEKMISERYLTSAVVANIFLAKPYGFDQGFERYMKANELRTSTEYVTENAEKWIKANREQDFFLWLHYLDPHQAYRPIEEFVPEDPVADRLLEEWPLIFQVRAGKTRFSRPEMQAMEALYDGEVRYVDNRVGRLFGLLKEWGLYDNSLIIISADHGEEFWEHGCWEHGHSLYDELLRVPLLIRLPGGRLRNTYIDAPVPLTAVYATILDLCGISYDREAVSACSLAPFLRDESGAFFYPHHKAAYPMVYEPKESLHFGPWKYIRAMTTDREELYNLQEDPEEQHNIAYTMPEQLAEARAILSEIADEEAALREHWGIEGPTTIELDKETIQELSDMGYL
ncbi:MAG: sulfatase, partial [Candidatus Hydrogenedentota bacterium]